jgi:hypothetical protein
MTAGVPIACTLTAAEVPQRMAEIAALGAGSLVSAQITGARAVLRFRARPGTRERLETIVAAEAKCCAFLTMRLDGRGDALVLTIDGPHDAEPVLRDLVAGFGVAADVAA